MVFHSSQQQKFNGVSQFTVQQCCWSEPFSDIWISIGWHISSLLYGKLVINMEFVQHRLRVDTLHHNSSHDGVFASDHGQQLCCACVSVWRRRFVFFCLVCVVVVRCDFVCPVLCVCVCVCVCMCKWYNILIIIIMCV